MAGVSATECLPVELEFDSGRPAKRRKLATDVVEEEKESIQYQPNPLPTKRQYASFLEVLDCPPRRYRPESVASSVTAWVEATVELDDIHRKRHCRSETTVRRPKNPAISRRLTRSAPIMAYRRDSDGYALPLTPYTPASSRSRSHRRDQDIRSSASVTDVSNTSATSSRKKTETPFYRHLNLASNNIHLRSRVEELPENVARLVDYMGHDRASPSPSLGSIERDTELRSFEEEGAAEANVEEYFNSHIFPNPRPSDGLKRTFRNQMSKHAVPDYNSTHKVSTPAPDSLYGYDMKAFSQQHTQISSMGNEPFANTQSLLYPFFVIEFKAEGPSAGGNLWVATNQCLGASASCVNMAERLNSRLRHCKDDEIQKIDSSAFSIAMHGTEARLYISWKHDDLQYYSQKINSFFLQRPAEYVEFRKYVRNIVDWGKDERLNKIRQSLDDLLEESRKAASQLAKSRTPPISEESSSGSSRSRRRTDSVSDTAAAGYWQWDANYKRHYHLDSSGEFTWAPSPGESSSTQQ